MSEELSMFSTPEINGLVQDMRNLLSQGQLAFILGAGCSKCAGLPLMPDLTEIVLANESMSDETKILLAKVRESFSGARFVNIEDYMSEIVDLLSIAERHTRSGSPEFKEPLEGYEMDADQLQSALDEIKGAIASAIGEKEVNATTHQKFIRSIHNSLIAGKDHRNVDYFILNYDTLIEDALGLERVLFCDGFNGAATGWWEPCTFESVGIETRVFKIHGSIDWRLLKDDPLPRRIRSGVKTEINKKHILIYPGATKYLETQRDPFAQMLHHLRDSLCPSKGEGTVLAICGYNFGDSHIDVEIENALHQSKGELTVAIFVSTDEPEGKIRKWLDDETISPQIRVYTNKGYFHDNKELKIETELPWWKFEILARLLGGER